jgi:hypothetical protein
MAWLQAAELVDDDHVVGAAWQPMVGIFGEREIVGFPQFEEVFFAWLRVTGEGSGGRAGGLGFGRFSAGSGHWPASSASRMSWIKPEVIW